MAAVTPQTILCGIERLSPAGKVVEAATSQSRRALADNGGQAVDPSNPMAYFFLQKKTEWEKSKKKKNRELWILVIVCVALCLGVFIYLYLTGELSKESPLEKLINKYL